MEKVLEGIMNEDAIGTQRARLKMMVIEMHMHVHDGNDVGIGSTGRRK